jgi:hypothetical protein
MKKETLAANIISCALNTKTFKKPLDEKASHKTSPVYFSYQLSHIPKAQ